MGKMVRWTKRRGWEIGPTPYQYRIMALEFWRRWRFAGLRPAINARPPKLRRRARS